MTTETKIKTSVNPIFGTAKIAASLSVICAHLTTFSNAVVKMHINRLGSIGVVVFFVLSGFFFHYQKYANFYELLKSKTKAIFLPWMFFGSIYYIAMIVSGIYKTNCISRYLLCVFGVGTPFYYLTVSTLFYVFFYVLSRTLSRKYFSCILVLMILVNMLSVRLTVYGFFDATLLNPLNWIGYFSIGLLLQQVEDNKIVLVLQKIRVGIILLFLVIYAVLVYFDIPVGYFTKIGLFYQTLGALSVLSICSYPIIYKSSFLQALSPMTFSVYLIHMPVIGVTKWIYNYLLITQILSPFIMAGLCYLAVYLGHVLSKRLHISKFYNAIVGIRIT